MFASSLLFCFFFSYPLASDPALVLHAQHNTINCRFKYSWKHRKRTITTLEWDWSGSYTQNVPTHPLRLFEVISIQFERQGLEQASLCIGIASTRCSETLIRDLSFRIAESFWLLVYFPYIDGRTDLCRSSRNQIYARTLLGLFVHLKWL